MSNYYALFSGHKAKAKADSLLSNLCTKIFFANDCFVTNQWAANAIGKTFIDMYSSSGSAGNNYQTTSSSSIRKELHYRFQPHQFRFLKTGGKINNNIVEGIALITGKELRGGEGALEFVKFKQNF